MPLDFSVGDALDLATVSEPAANADGSRVGFLRTADGATEFVAADVPAITETDLGLEAGAAVEHASTDHGDVSAFDWRPGEPDEAAVVADGTLFRYDATGASMRTVVDGPEDCDQLAWHPDGSVLAYTEAGLLWLYDLATGGHRALNPDSAEVADEFGGTPVRWSADGSAVATKVQDSDGVMGLAAFALEEDGPIWQRVPDVTAGRLVPAFDWVGDDRLVYAEDTTEGDERVYRVANVTTAAPGTALLSERDDHVLARDRPIGSDDGRFAVLSGRTGFHHVYVVDVSTRRSAVDSARPGFTGPGVVQVTDGEFESRGDARDVPVWGPADRRLAFVTNERDPGERHVRIVELDDLTVVARVAFEDLPGNAVQPAWLGASRVGFVRSGRTTPADVFVADIEQAAVRRISAAHPDPDVFDHFPEPEPISFEGRGGLEIPGYLYAPPEAEPGEDRPAVVWAHGGPMRQMRRGFHHMQSYASFHAFNHALLSEGYIVLAVNYRGGIGYGRAFEHGLQDAIGVDEVDDCVRAAEWLRRDPRIGDRIGLWGLSYGGFLANAVATKTDAFDAAVNFAGIWDWREWVRWSAEDYRGAARVFEARFGGAPDSEDPAVSAAYDRASPAAVAEGLTTPLFALHGSGDPIVPFDQMDSLVGDLVQHGADFEMAYYPEEDHMFQAPATWTDALTRVLSFLAAHLRS
jgi:dipeptidyl aminopeptidase/acylaminoacyl peptidase